MFNASSSFLRELEESIAEGSERGRLRALWHATDLLIAGQYSEEQIWTFGEVIDLLARELEEASRTKLARLLANSRNAPVNCINKLAHDDSIDVAGPILRQSERLDTRTLVSIAASASQAHLLAISRRKSVNEPVTDVLVSVGNREVIHSLANNLGARFSHFGFLQMIKRSENDSILIESLWIRRDIPRSIFQQLIAKASDEAKEKLERECPATAAEIQTVVADVTGELHSIFGPGSKDYFGAKKTVAALHRYGDLSEKKIFEYAQSHKLPEVTAGLSLLCSLPAHVIERGLMDQTGEMAIVFAKALDFSWETTMSLLFLGAPDYKMYGRDLDELSRKFSRLKIETAQSIIGLCHSRKTQQPCD
jgi:uncharacterized protein (DUF2336 family)